MRMNLEQAQPRAYRFVTLPKDSAVGPAAGAFVARGGARAVVICSMAVSLRSERVFSEATGR